MKHVLAVVIVMAASGAAMAQEDRDLDRRVQRLKDSLKLNDEQAAKAKEIYKADKEATDKLEKERQDKLKEILTDDQKKSYDELLNGGGQGGRRAPGGGQGGQGGFGGGMMDRMLGPTMDQLKSELTLTDEQVGKIQPVVDEFRKKAQDRFDELRQGGFQGMNWREEMDNFRKSMEETGSKVKEHLTEEQKTKFDALVKQRGGGAGGNNGGGNTPSQDRRGLSVDERVKRAMDALKIENGDEATAIKDLIKKVAEAQVALESWDRDSRPKIDETLGNKDLKDEDLETKLKDLRTQRKEKEQAIKDAQKALAEVVSYRQELELIKQNILR
jgi:hypothetical protein